MNSKEFAIKAYVVNSSCIILLICLTLWHIRKGEKLRSVYEQFRSEYQSMDKSDAYIKKRFDNMFVCYLNNSKPQILKYAFGTYFWVSISILCTVSPMIYHYL